MVKTVRVNWLLRYLCGIEESLFGTLRVVSASDDGWYFLSNGLHARTDNGETLDLGDVVVVNRWFESGTMVVEKRY